MTGLIHMELRLGAGLKATIQLILQHKGQRYFKERIEQTIVELKQEVYQDFKAEYINNKMTAREYKALTGDLPDAQMHHMRIHTLKDIKDAYQERFYLTLLAQNQDHFGHADEYFAEILTQVEEQAS